MASNNAVAADELRLLIERVERIEEEIKAVQQDRKEVYAEAKSRGFCVKTMKTMVKQRKEKPDDRREREAMEDLYKAALGMLDGTPLGSWAVKKLTGDDADDDGDDDGADGAGLPPVVQPETTVADARRLGGEAARSGKPVTANPFPPRDVRRAAWDEAWCHELGSDGMEIPEALRPAPKKPKPEADPDRCDSTSDMFQPEGQDA